MFIWISRCQLNRIEHFLNRTEHIMSTILTDFLTDFRAILDKVAQGGNSDPTMKAAVEELTAKTTALAEQLAGNDANDAANAAIIADLKTAITELVTKLAVSTPPAKPVEPTE